MPKPVAEQTPHTSASTEPTTSSDLYLEILERLIDDQSLTDRDRTLVDAALRGDADLGAALSDSSSDVPLVGAQRAQARGPKPPRVFIEKISVRGFRGAGDHVELKLRPGPGLTLVVGRNGTGKSTFVDGLETLLTGTTQRWDERKEWSAGWKNLGTEHAPLVSCELMAEGIGRCVATRSWSHDAGLGGGELTFSEAASGSEKAFDWAAACSTEQPFLGYRQLATVVEKPSSVFDALHSVLGLELFDVGIKRVDDAASSLTRRGKDVDHQKKTALAALAASTQEGTAALLELLGAKRVDLAALEASLSQLESAQGEDDPELTALARASLPTLDEWKNAGSDLETAIRDRDSAQSATLSGNDQLLQLLDCALPHFETAGEPCPVCGSQLVAEQVGAIRARAETLREATSAYRAAEKRLKELQQAAVLLVGRLCEMPTALVELATATLSPADLSSLAARVRVSPSDARQAILDHEAHVTALREAQPLAVGEIQRRGAELRKATRPVAVWLEGARQDVSHKAHLAELKKTKAWLKATAEDMREARFAPLAAATVSNWKTLGADSSVVLSGVKLAGSKTTRKIDLQVQVDGRDAPGVAVLSQGEVNCMALSLFLPRAITQTGPFRFVLIDDPVQAMDQVRVGGLAQVLHGAAQHLQVVVFTHDMRLVSSVRRQQLPATILEVHRHANSKLEVREFVTPHLRYLKDANAVAYSKGTSDELPRRVVPGFCRMAVEAACQERIYRTRLGAGGTFEAIDDLLREVRERNNLFDLVSLAFYDDPSRWDDVVKRLKQIRASGELTALFSMKQTHGSGFSGSRTEVQDLVRHSTNVCDLLLEER